MGNNSAVNPIIGVDMAHYAILDFDPLPSVGTGSLLPIYREPISLPNVRSIGIGSTDTSATEYYDNAPRIVIMAKSDKTLNFTRASFTNEEKRSLLGWKRTEDGSTFETGDSLPPYIAFAFRRLKYGGHYDYVWYLKGIMALNQLDSETRQATITVQNLTMTGTFITRQCDNAYVITKATDDPGFEPGSVKDWFTAGTINRLMTEAGATPRQAPGKAVNVGK